MWVPPICRASSSPRSCSDEIEKIEPIQNDRIASWKAYDMALQPFHRRGLRTPVVPPACEANGHLYFVLMPSPDLRRELMARMRADGIETPFHYVPLHSAPAGLRFARVSGRLPHTEDLSARLVRLPLYPRMGDAGDHVVERITTHLDRSL